MTTSERFGGSAPTRHPVRTAALSVLATVGVLVVLSVIVISVVRPWDAVTPQNALPPLATSSDDPSGEASESPSAEPSESSTTGASELPIFDDHTARALLMVRSDITTSIPGASNGVELSDADTALQWSLATGTATDLVTCGLAVGVVTGGPGPATTRIWTTAGLRVEQEVRVFADSAAAASTFAELVGAIDACPTFAWTSPVGVPSVATTVPATEAQSVFASLYQDVEQTTGGMSFLGVRGHVLVSNAIVTWTVLVQSTGNAAGDRSTIGTGSDLDGFVQDRISEAVSAMR